MRPLTRGTQRARIASVIGLVLCLGLAGCGFDAQTQQPDTPGQGVNADAGTVKLRDIVIVSTDEGSGRVAGALAAPEEDQLASVTGFPLKADGSHGEPFSSTVTTLTIPAGGLLDLTFGSGGVTLRSPDLTPGYSAELTFRFRSGEHTTLRTVVVDTGHPAYASVTPVPEISAEATVAPPQSASPTSTPTR